MERPLILNRYRPLEESIQGGMSTVEIAWDTRIQRRVAIKRIPLGGVAPDQIPGLGEARTAAMLSHPSIVQVYDFEFDTDDAFLIMEYIDGPTLSAAIDIEDGQLSLDEAAAVFQAASEAIAYAHENGVLHLDVKPDNILLSQSGSIKVADFGMSELETATGWNKAQGGTIGYMPPEQLQGDAVDIRTDEWALASVAYEMLCGENPFYSNNVDRSLQTIERFEITPPSEIRDDLDPGIDDVLLRALSPEKEGRFATVEEFAEALAPFLGDPAKGRRELRVAISPENVEEREEVPAGLGLWDRMSDRGRESLSRACAAICCAWVTYMVTYATFLPLAVVLTCTAAVVAGGILAPTLCAALTMIIVGVSLILGKQVIAGAVVLALGLVWWLVFGRRKSPDAALPFSASALGIIHLAPAFPLIAGFALPVKRAAVVATAGGILAMLISAWTGGATIANSALHGIYTPDITAALAARMTDPSAWIAVITWIFAAILMSALCSKGSRALSIAGAAIGCVVMIGGQVLGGFLATGAWNVPDAITFASMAASFALMCVIAALGAPYRAEDGSEGE